MSQAKRRARRIAADEAHSWARNLRLNNPHAKLTLSMLSLYVDGDGCCFVSIPTLADDTELSPQTVRSRLAWLEEIGAIVRLPQWVDELGRRNGEQRGKRTSDLIQLLIETDPAVIEAAANGDPSVVSREVSPMPQTGLNNAADPICNNVSPAPALRQPYDSAEGLKTEPEPESSPKPPSRGPSDADRLDEGEAEPEHFAPAWLAYRRHEVMRRDLGLEAFRELPPDKQRLCRAAVPHYMAALKPNERPQNFNVWVKARGFEAFPDARLGDDLPKPPERRFVQGAELEGLQIASLIADRRELPVRREPEHGEGVWRTLPHQPDLVALAACGRPSDAWQVVEIGSDHYAAWRDRLRLWLGFDPRPEKVWLEPEAEVHRLPPLHADFKVRKSKQGLRVPATWPPRRNGQWSGSDDASQAAGETA
jgi:hypothetical protein